MNKLKNFTIYNGGVKLFFGNNSIKYIDKYLENYSKLLIVTGKKSAKTSGALKDVEEILSGKNIDYEVYDKVFPNPTDDLVRDLVDYYREGVFEGYIAIGGGSVIDLVKACRVVAVGGGDIKDYLYGLKKPPTRQPFLLAINLTHGTGSEIDRYSVINIRETGEKIGFSAGYPDVSIDDPRYTLTLPRNQSIYTSIDAFTHAVESATSRYSSPYTELLAGETIYYIVKYLPKTIDKPSDLEARYWLLYASMIAGISIDHGVTHIGHVIEHLLSGYNPEIPHGAGLAILYIELIRYIYEYYPETMARLLKPLDNSLKPLKEYSEKAREKYIEFLDGIGFHERLSDYGLGRDDLRHIVDKYVENIDQYHRLSDIVFTGNELYELLEKLL